MEGANLRADGYWGPACNGPLFLNTQVVMAGRNTMFMEPEDYARMKEKYPKFNEPWTKEDVSELEAMAQDKVALDAMAESLQRTNNAVRMKLKALGLWESRPKGLPWTEEANRDLVEMYEEGEAFEDMAARFNRSINAVVSHLVHLRVSLFAQ